MTEKIFEKETELLEELLLVLKIVNKEILEKELSKVASTNDRKLMWVLFDGKTRIKDIAKKINKTERTVQYFVNDLVNLGFIDPQRGLPRKLLNYLPTEWLRLDIKKEEKTDERENTEQTE